MATEIYDRCGLPRASAVHGISCMLCEAAAVLRYSGVTVSEVRVLTVSHIVFSYPARRKCSQQQYQLVCCMLHMASSRHVPEEAVNQHVRKPCTVALSHPGHQTFHV